MDLELLPDEEADPQLPVHEVHLPDAELLDELAEGGGDGVRVLRLEGESRLLHLSHLVAHLGQVDEPLLPRIAALQARDAELGVGLAPALLRELEASVESDLASGAEADLASRLLHQLLRLVRVSRQLATPCRCCHVFSSEVFPPLER